MNRNLVTAIVSTFLFLCLNFLFCKDIEVDKKIDPNFKPFLQNLKDNSQLNQKVSVVFKVNEDITDLHLRVLKNNDVNIIANIGHIYTASLPASKIYNLAKLKFVEYIQSSRRLQTTPGDSIKQAPKLKETIK